MERQITRGPTGLLVPTQQRRHIAEALRAVGFILLDEHTSNSKLIAYAETKHLFLDIRSGQLMLSLVNEGFIQEIYLSEAGRMQLSASAFLKFTLSRRNRGLDLMGEILANPDSLARRAFREDTSLRTLIGTNGDSNINSTYEARLALPQILERSTLAKHNLDVQEFAKAYLRILQELGHNMARGKFSSIIQLRDEVRDKFSKAPIAELAKKIVLEEQTET
ncbi:MAG: hypothetical protein AABX38_03805 [Candidatus Micrarchaeota archaeon]